MWKDWFAKGWPIGCEVDGRWLRLAQVQQRGDRATVAGDSRRIPAGLEEGDPRYATTVSGLIREMVQSRRFRGRSVVTCLPHHHVRHRMMRVVAMPEQELAQAAHWKAASELGLKADAFRSAVLNFGPVAEGGKPKLEILLVAAEVSRLEQHATLLAAAGLEPLAIDVATCAALRCLGPASATTPSFPWLVLELSHAAAVLAITENATPAFIRPLGEGLGRVDHLLADLLQVPLDEAISLRQSLEAGPGDEPWPSSSCPPGRVQEAMANAAGMYARDLGREVALSLHYFAETFHKRVPSTAVVFSPGAVAGAAAAALSDQLGIGFVPCGQALRLDWAAAPGAGPQATFDSWATAVGLSLYGWGQSPAQQAA